MSPLPATPVDLRIVEIIESFRRQRVLERVPHLRIVEIIESFRRIMLEWGKNNLRIVEIIESFRLTLGEVTATLSTNSRNYRVLQTLLPFLEAKTHLRIVEIIESFRRHKC